MLISADFKQFPSTEGTKLSGFICKLRLLQSFEQRHLFLGPFSWLWISCWCLDWKLPDSPLWEIHSFWNRKWYQLMQLSCNKLHFLAMVFFHFQLHWGGQYWATSLTTWIHLYTDFFLIFTTVLNGLWLVLNLGMQSHLCGELTKVTWRFYLRGGWHPKFPILFKGQL